MKTLTNMLLSIMAVFFLSGCGSDSSEPSGVTGFTYAMIEDKPFYTFDEKDNWWIRVIFDSSGQVLYEISEGSVVGGTYSIVDGKIIVTDNDKDPTIALDVAGATVWEVTGTDNDGRVWQDTWHFEQKITSEMLVGKRFFNQYERDGTIVSDEIAFTNTTVQVYDTNGELENEFSYVLEDGNLVVIDDEAGFTLHLMFVDNNGNYNMWYSSDDRSNSSIWILVEG